MFFPDFQQIFPLRILLGWPTNDFDPAGAESLRERKRERVRRHTQGDERETTTQAAYLQL
jgi:hypothetical protein